MVNPVLGPGRHAGRVLQLSLYIEITHGLLRSEPQDHRRDRSQ